jgi:aminopeptidase N
MTAQHQSFRFPNLATRPIVSLLRGFSAPVILDRPGSPEERAFLLAHDTDPFNKWEAGRSLAKNVLTQMVTKGAQPGPDWLKALARVVQDDGLDPAFRALALDLPAEDDMAQTLHDAGTTPDPDLVHTARRRMSDALARHLSGPLPRLIEDLAEPGPFTAEARAAGRRSLRLALLRLLSRLDGGARAAAAFRAADNMTEQVGALGCLLEIGQGQAELAAFEAQWGQDRLVMDKWFSLQILHAAPDRAAAVATRLTAHSAFDWRNPNRYRAVIGALSANHAGFHAASGAGYRFVADWLIRLDPLNPQTAARMSTAFETWSRYDAARQRLVKAELRRIRSAPGLSRDLGEMTGRMLGEKD